MGLRKSIASYNIYIGVIIFLAIITILGVASFLLAGNFTNSFTNRVNLSNVVLNVLLTSALVIGYFLFASIQKTQTNIMEKQERLMELQQEPRIRVRGYDASGPESIRLDIRNTGNGLAEKICLRTDVAISGDGGNMSISTGSDKTPRTAMIDEVELTKSGGKSRYEPKETPLIREESHVATSDYHLGGVLTPEEGQVIFDSRLRFSRYGPNGVEDKIYLRELLDDLRGYNITGVTLAVNLVYTDLSGEIHITRTPGMNFDLEDDIEDMFDVFANGYYFEFGNTKPILERVEQSKNYPPIE